MIWIRINDPNRIPSHWLDLIRDGQYAVFVIDARTRLARDYDGKPFGPNGEACAAICEDRASAIEFARRTVNQHPEVCCEIYNHEGKTGAPLEVIYEDSVRGKYIGLPVAKRETIRGSLLISCGIAFIALDVARDLLWMWGYIVGLKLCLIGGSFLVRGITGIYEHRKPLS